MSFADRMDDSFNPDFASPADWARMYRACGLQVVPGRPPDAHKSWKVPLLGWTGFQEELVPDFTFERWYGESGEYSSHTNMGLIMGRCSRNAITLDLDIYKHRGAAEWWQGLLVINTMGIEPETCEQRTGGGGRQLVFRAPHGLEISNSAGANGVDVRGQGGWVICPPSMHTSGQAYEWLPGRGPWECEIAETPDWLLRAIAALAPTAAPHGPRERTASPSGTLNAFGAKIDRREEYMRDVVWAAVVDMAEECPVPPDLATSEARLLKTYAAYRRNVRPRVPGRDADDALEREGRGLGAFREKWARALGRWQDVLQAVRERPASETAGTGGNGANGSYDPNDFADAGTERARGEGGQLVITADEFVKGFTPPDYLVDGMLQRGYLYSLTARTGHGKTAVAMYGGACVSLGRAIGKRGVKQGSVLMLAGENPDDIRARLLVLAEAMAFKPRDVPLHFVAGVVNIAASMPAIREAAEHIGDLMLVIVDTAAAYFLGDDANSNTQQGGFARQLRELSFLPGKPAVLVCCHPVKNAAKDNLTPMGGSAFLNEVDGNLTLWSGVESQTTLHWQGKFRGPEFEPMTFRLRTETSVEVRDSDGVLIPSIVAEPMNDLEVEAGEQTQESEENRLLAVIGSNPPLSIRELASKANFVGPGGEVLKSKVGRLCQDLFREKLVTIKRKKYRITPAGKKELGWSEDDD